MKKRTIYVVLCIVAFIAVGKIHAEDHDSRKKQVHNLIEIVSHEMGDDMKEKDVKRILNKMEKLIPELSKLKALSFAREEGEENVEVVVHLIHEYKEGQELRNEEPREYMIWKKRFVSEWQGRIKTFLLDRKSMELGRQLHNCKDEVKRKQLSNELQGLLEKIFNSRMKERQNEINNIEKELKELKGLMNRRIKNKARIIRKRYDDLTGHDDDLEWH